MKLTMIANKPMRYGTRRLLPGDTFECDGQHSRVLIATRRASVYDRPKADIPPIPETVRTRVSAVADTMTTLRAEYQAKVGKRAYHGWDADELRRRIDGPVDGEETDGE
jgi:hypothetical protein